MKLEKVTIAPYLFAESISYQGLFVNTSLNGIYLYKVGNRISSHWYHYANQKIDYTYFRTNSKTTKSFYIR